MSRTLQLTSPLSHGPDVTHAQRLLTRSRFGNFHPGPVDGTFGQVTAAACSRAKYRLGYALGEIEPVYGSRLDGYLRGTKISPVMLVRRLRRLRELEKTRELKARALALAVEEARKGVTEYPPGSNRNPYGAWYGLNGEPWCAIFVTWCFVHAGDRWIFQRGSRTAWAYWAEEEARSGSRYLRITGSPEPGDLVVYHHHEGHIEIFRRWTDRGLGKFETVGGNTSVDGSQDNGGAVLVRERDTGWAPTVFVRVTAK